MDHRVRTLENEQRLILQRLAALEIRVDVPTRSLRDDKLVSAAIRDGGLIILELIIAVSTVTDRLERAKLISYINEYELDRVSITNLAELQRALDVALKTEDDRVKRVYNERQSSR